MSYDIHVHAHAHAHAHTHAHSQLSQLLDIYHTKFARVTTYTSDMTQRHAHDMCVVRDEMRDAHDAEMKTVGERHDAEMKTARDAMQQQHVDAMAHLTHEMTQLQGDMEDARIASQHREEEMRVERDKMRVMHDDMQHTCDDKDAEIHTLRDRVRVMEQQTHTYTETHTRTRTSTSASKHAQRYEEKEHVDVDVDVDDDVKQHTPIQQQQHTASRQKQQTSSQQKHTPSTQPASRSSATLRTSITHAITSHTAPRSSLASLHTPHASPSPLRITTTNGRVVKRSLPRTNTSHDVTLVKRQRATSSQPSHTSSQSSHTSSPSPSQHAPKRKSSHTAIPMVSVDDLLGRRTS